MGALAIVELHDGLTLRATHAHGAWIDGWSFDPLTHRIRGVGDLDGDGRDEFIVTSDWGIGVLKHDGSRFRCPFGAPRNTLLGAWRYDALTRAQRDRIAAVGDFSGLGRPELLIFGAAGIGTLGWVSGRLESTLVFNNGTRLGGWVINSTTDRFMGSAQLAGVRGRVMVLRSPWGMGLISLNARRDIAMVPFGTAIGSWTLRETDSIVALLDADGDGSDELLISGTQGIALLKIVGRELTAAVHHRRDSSIGRLRVGDPLWGVHVGRLRREEPQRLIVGSHRGLYSIALIDRVRLETRAFASNGEALGGWTLNTATDALLPLGDLSGDANDDFLIRSGWGIGIIDIWTGDRFRCRSMLPYGSLMDEWTLAASTVVIGAGSFTEAGRRQVLLMQPVPNPAAAPARSRATFENWHRNIRRELSQVRPNHLHELVSAVRAIETRGERAGIMGSGWSYTNCVVGAGTRTLIDTSAMNRTLAGVIPDVIDDRLPDGRRLVHVEAGIKLFDLNCRLDAMGLALATMGGSRGQSIAGVMSTSVHGADVSLPPIADAIRAIHLVGAGGRQWWVEPTLGGISDPSSFARARATGALDATITRVADDAWFNALLVAFGCAGVIYSVVIECRPAFRLAQIREESSWPAAHARIAGLARSSGRPRYLEINVNAADRSCIVTTREETTEAATVPPPPAPIPMDLIAAVALGLGPAAIPLASPLAIDISIGTLMAMISDYVARTTAEITALGFLPGGFILQAQKTAESLRPVEDLHRLIVELGLLTIDPHNAQRVADVLPTAVNLIWAIGAWVVPGRVLVDQLQRELTRSARPVGRGVGESYQVMTSQPPCGINGEQTHGPTERLVESFEYAVEDRRAIAFVNRLLDLVAELRLRPDALIVNLNLRFTGRSRATLGMQRFERTCHVEIYTFRGMRGNAEFHRRLQPIVREFTAVPHWGQLHALAEVDAYGTRRVEWRNVMRLISEGRETFWSDFARERGLLP